MPVPCSTVEMSIAHPNCTEGASLGNAVRSSAGSSAAEHASPSSASFTVASAGAGAGGKAAAFGQWPKNVAGGSMGYIVHTSVGGDPVRYTEWVRYNKTSGKCTRCGSCPACYHAHRWTHLKMRNENAHYERWKQVVIYFQKEETSRGGRSRRVGCVWGVWGRGRGFRRCTVRYLLAPVC